MKQALSFVSIFTLAFFTLAGCQQAAPSEELPPQQTQEPQIPAEVESVDLLMMESFPLQMSVNVKGNLKNGCEKLGEVLRKRNGNDFTLTVTVVEEGEVCTQALVPFEENYSLDIYGLQKGEYTVTVNGMTENFTLDQDNVLDS
ncbi:MAG TPA: hypothetical protein VI588_04335 [Candidatus Gracilibacteria bacterium]|nr:hypothetical protein [Candidatus Gracilibacteria bacterium]